MPGRGRWSNSYSRVFERGLAGERVSFGAYQRIDRSCRTVTVCPMHGYKHTVRWQVFVERDAESELGVFAAHARKPTGREAQLHCACRVHTQRWLVLVFAESRRTPCARQRMPVISHPARVEHQ